MPVHAHRQIREVASHKQQRNEDNTLQPAAAGQTLGEIAKFCSDSQAENENQHQNAERVRNKIEGVAGARVSHGFFVAVFGQSVLLGLAARSLGAFGLGQAGNGGLRGRGTIGRRLRVDGGWGVAWACRDRKRGSNANGARCRKDRPCCIKLLAKINGTAGCKIWGRWGV